MLEREDQRWSAEGTELVLQGLSPVAKLGSSDLVSSSGGTLDDVGEADIGSHRRVVLEPLA